MRQRADARADGDHQLGDGRHHRRDCPRARARPGRGAPPQHAAVRADLPYTMRDGRACSKTSRPARRSSAASGARLSPVSASGRRRRARRGIHRGLGLSCVVESTTYGSAFYKAAGIPGSGHEAAWVKIEPSGAVNASVGLMASGQGYETAFAQVVAATLGVDPAQVQFTSRQHRRRALRHGQPGRTRRHGRRRRAPARRHRRCATRC